jgi:hypothetical protein
MMQIIDYLKAKYGVMKPTTILFAEAKSFGIPYPLKQGWLRKYGNVSITPDMSAMLYKNLNKMVADVHPNKASALLGLKVLRHGRINFENLPKADSNEFLESSAWKRLRIQAFEKYGNKCQCCGASPQDGVRLNVDHIQPRKLFPELALSLDNLQILCSDCNHGKGNWSMSDWRHDAQA